MDAERDALQGVGLREAFAEAVGEVLLALVVAEADQVLSRQGTAGDVVVEHRRVRHVGKTSRYQHDRHLLADDVDQLTIVLPHSRGDDRVDPPLHQVEKNSLKPLVALGRLCDQSDKSIGLERRGDPPNQWRVVGVVETGDDDSYRLRLAPFQARSNQIR